MWVGFVFLWFYMIVDFDRWITLLMSQEFPLPEVLRIWDSLLSDRKRFDFLIDLACAMIM